MPHHTIPACDCVDNCCLPPVSPHTHPCSQDQVLNWKHRKHSPHSLHPASRREEGRSLPDTASVAAASGNARLAQQLGGIGAALSELVKPAKLKKADSMDE